MQIHASQEPFTAPGVSLESQELASLVTRHRGVIHDLGGFVQSILSNAELLEQALRDAERASGTPSFVQEVASAELNRATRAILESARGAGELLHVALSQSSRVSPCCRLELVLQRLESIAQNWGATLRMPMNLPDMELAVGSEELLRVLMNLLRNSLEAMQGKGTWGLEILRWTQCEIDLGVWDLGPGIEPSRRESVFRAGASTKCGGHGLGLSGSRALLRAVGGEIWCVEPRPCEGARFLLRIPRVGGNVAVKGP